MDPMGMLRIVEGWTSNWVNYRFPGGTTKVDSPTDHQLEALLPQIVNDELRQGGADT